VLVAASRLFWLFAPRLVMEHWALSRLQVSTSMSVVSTGFTALTCGLLIAGILLLVPACARGVAELRGQNA
jgi:hypothetical protein